MNKMLALVVILSAAVAVAGHGNCTTFEVHDDVLTPKGPAKKFCYQCQWECLTNKQCTNITYVGTEDGVTETANVSKAELATFDCTSVNSADDVDKVWTNKTLSPGLCVLYDTSAAGLEEFPAGIYDVQEQGCVECMQQCFYDAKCTSFVWDYLPYEKVLDTALCPVVVVEETEDPGNKK